MESGDCCGHLMDTIKASAKPISIVTVKSFSPVRMTGSSSTGIWRLGSVSRGLQIVKYHTVSSSTRTSRSNTFSWPDVMIRRYTLFRIYHSWKLACCVVTGIMLGRSQWQYCSRIRSSSQPDQHNHLYR